PFAPNRTTRVAYRHGRKIDDRPGAAYGRGRPPRVCACSRFHRSSSRIPSRMFHAPSAIARGRLCCMMLGNWLLVQDAPGRLLTPVAPTATAGWPSSGRSVVWTADARVIASLSSGVEIWDQAWRFFPGGRTNRVHVAKVRWTNSGGCGWFNLTDTISVRRNLADAGSHSALRCPIAGAAVR